MKKVMKKPIKDSYTMMTRSNAIGCLTQVSVQITDLACRVAQVPSNFPDRKSLVAQVTALCKLQEDLLANS